MEENAWGSLSTEAYDIIHADAPAEALEFYLRRLESRAEPALEPMCGSGRFLVPFLEHGVAIDGIDSSRQMLDKCRQRCEAKGFSPALYEQYLQELDLPRRYGYMFIPEGSFGLIIDQKAASESLRRLYQHLLPGGKLLMEITTPKGQTKTPGQSNRFWLQRSDGAVIGVSRLPTYDPGTRVQRCTSTYELLEEGHAPRVEEGTVELRLYERDEFTGLLKEAGFTKITATKPYKDDQSDEEDPLIVFECRRGK